MPSQKKTRSSQQRHKGVLGEPDHLWKQYESPAKVARKIGVPAWAVEKAKVYYDHAQSRGVLNGFLIAGVDDREILEATGLEPPVLQAYKGAFFDVKAIPAQIDKLQYIDRIRAADPEVATLMLVALRGGVDYLRWMLSGAPVHINVLEDAAPLLAGLKTASLSPDNLSKLYQTLAARMPPPADESDIVFLIRGLNDGSQTDKTGDAETVE